MCYKFKTNHKMETQKKGVNKYKIVAVALTFALVSSLGGLVYYQHNNSGLKDGLAKSKLETEKTLSEKLAAEKSAFQLKKDMTTLQGLKKSLEAQLADKVKELVSKEKQLAGYKNDSKKLKDAKEELKTLKAVETALERDIESLNNTLSSISEELNKLKSENLALANQNKMLNDNVNTLCQSIINNSMTEALKKNGNLTVNARRTKAIKIGFDLPEEMSTGLTCKITSPEGKILSSLDDDSNISMAVEESDEELTAGEGVIGSKGSGTKHTVITWKADKKLKPGIYQLEVFNGSKNLGKTAFRLK